MKFIITEKITKKDISWIEEKLKLTSLFPIGSKILFFKRKKYLITVFEYLEGRAEKKVFSSRIYLNKFEELHLFYILLNLNEKIHFDKQYFHDEKLLHQEIFNRIDKELNYR